MIDPVYFLDSLFGHKRWNRYMKQKNIIFFFFATAMIVKCNATDLASNLANAEELQRMYDELAQQNDALVRVVESNFRQTTVIVDTNSADNPFACPPIAPLVNRRIEQAVAGLRTQLEEQAASFNAEREGVAAQHELALREAQACAEGLVVTLAARNEEVERLQGELDQHAQDLRDAQTRANALNAEVLRLQAQAGLLPGLNEDIARLRADIGQRDQALREAQTRANDVQIQVGRIPNLHDQIRRLEAALAQLGAEAARVPDLNAEVLRLQMELAQARGPAAVPQGVVLSAKKNIIPGF